MTGKVVNRAIWPTGQLKCVNAGGPEGGDEGMPAQSSERRAKLAAWACIISAAILQYQVPGTARQKLLMFGVALVAMILARGMTVVEYRIRQRRFLIMAGDFRSALRFRGVLDKPFI